MVKNRVPFSAKSIKTLHKSRKCRSLHMVVYDCRGRPHDRCALVIVSGSYDIKEHTLLVRIPDGSEVTSPRANVSCYTCTCLHACDQVEFYVEAWILDADTVTTLAREVGVGIGDVVDFDPSTKMYTFNVMLDGKKVCAWRSCFQKCPVQKLVQMTRWTLAVTAKLGSMDLVQHSKLSEINDLRTKQGLVHVKLVEIVGIGMHTDGTAVYRCKFDDDKVLFRQDLILLHVCVRLQVIDHVWLHSETMEGNKLLTEVDEYRSDTRFYNCTLLQ